MEEEKQEMTWCYSLQSNSNWVISTALVVGWSQSANRVAALHSGIRARFRIGLFLPNETPTKFSTYMLEWVHMIFTSIPKLVDRWNVSSFHFHLPFSLLPFHPLSLSHLLSLSSSFSQIHNFATVYFPSSKSGKRKRFIMIEARELMKTFLSLIHFQKHSLTY